MREGGSERQSDCRRLRGPNENPTRQGRLTAETTSGGFPALPGLYTFRVNLTFSGTLWHWVGPAPHYFVTVPEGECMDLKAASKLVTYGWGMIPVRVRVGDTEWKTSLFPKDGGYIVPIRANVRKAEGLNEGDEVTVQLGVG